MSIINFDKPQVMVDIETLGKSANACTLAIGACRFDERDILDKFYININIESNIEAGRKIDGSTLRWWLQQNSVALNMLFEDTQSLEFALGAFAGWIRSDSCLWGCGAAFDNAILADAYECIGFETPWDFRNDRCYRTMKKLDHNVVEPERFGLHHNALDDAIHQARYLQAINSAL